MRYNLSLDRVTGMSTTGQYFYGGNFSFCNYDNLKIAKDKASEAMKNGYYNHAQIFDREDKTTIERLFGQDWKEIKQ